VGWSYVVRYDPRGRPVKYNVVEEDDIEEEDDAEEKVVVLDEEDEEVELDVDEMFSMIISTMKLSKMTLMMMFYAQSFQHRFQTEL
jgi:hypothetical protein